MTQKAPTTLEHCDSLRASPHCVRLRCLRRLAPREPSPLSVPPAVVWLVSCGRGWSTSYYE